MKKYSIIIVALIALVVIVFCVANQSSNETNVQPQGSTQAYLEGVANQISEAVKEDDQNEASSNKEETLEEETQVEAPNQVADNLEATDTQSEALESNEGDSPTSQYQKALNALLKDGYYFKDGKPEKIKSSASELRVLENNEFGIFARLDAGLFFDESPISGRPLIWINTNKIQLKDGVKKLVEMRDVNEIKEKLDSGVLFKDTQEYELENGIRFANGYLFCQAATYGLFANEEILILDTVDDTVSYIIKLN